MGAVGGWLDATIPAGDFESAEVDLGQDYEYLNVLAPSIVGKLFVEVAEKTTARGGTYFQLGKDVETEADGFNRADVWTLGRLQYIKIAVSDKQKGDVTIRVRGWRN